MVLADTSVWIDHLRNSNSTLIELLKEGKICCHPFIKGELACGNIKNREKFFELLDNQYFINLVTEKEALFFLNKHQLHGKGLGWIDIHLLAASFLNNTKLFTLDKKLSLVATELKVSF